MSEKDLIVKENGYLTVQNFNADSGLMEEMDGLTTTFDKVKIPSGGGLMFEVTGENGEPEPVKTIEGVILYHHAVNSFYKEKYTGGSNPPDCGSYDGKTGEGDPGGDCSKCPYGILHETLKSILSKANISSDEMLVENTSVYAGYQFDVTMSYLEGILEILKALENWKIEELVDGTVVIGSNGYSGFVRNSSYVFQRNKDIFTRSIVRDDQEAYRKVCVHTGDFSIKVYREVETYTGWNLQTNKTLYVNVPDGTSLSDAQNYAEQIASNLQYVGKIESFTGPFRPQIIIGDEAVIIGENGTTSLGQITEITHRFGKNGFYTDFTVDSGGRLGKGRLSDYIARLTRDKTSSNRLYE